MFQANPQGAEHCPKPFMCQGLYENICLARAKFGAPWCSLLWVLCSWRFLLVNPANPGPVSQWACYSPKGLRKLSWKVLLGVVAQLLRNLLLLVRKASMKHLQNASEERILISWFWWQMKMIPKPIAPTQVVGLSRPRITQITVLAS